MGNLNVADRIREYKINTRDLPNQWHRTGAQSKKRQRKVELGNIQNIWGNPCSK